MLGNIHPSIHPSLFAQKYHFAVCISITMTFDLQNVHPLQTHIHTNFNLSRSYHSLMALSMMVCCILCHTPTKAVKVRRHCTLSTSRHVVTSYFFKCKFAVAGILFGVVYFLLRATDDYVLPHQRLWTFDVLVCPLSATER